MTDTSAPENARPVVLIVSDRPRSDFAPLDDAATALDARAEFVGDAYAAMRRLQRDAERAIHAVLIDVAAADGLADRFCVLVQRYFPWIAPARWIPADNARLANRCAWLPDALDDETALRRLLESGSARIGVPPSRRIEPPPTATPPTATPPETSPAPPVEIPDAARAEHVTMHDAVRKRMTSDAGRSPVRRTPPRAAPATPADVDSTLTPAELDALLQPPRDSTEDRGL